MSGSQEHSVAHFQNMVEALQHRKETLGDKAAYIFRGIRGGRDVLTWDTLYDLSGRFAAVLRDMGVTHGDKVANTLPNSPERVVTEGGVLLSGATTVGTHYVTADGSDVIPQLRTSKASVLVLDPDLPNSPWKGLKNHVTMIDDDTVTSEILPELRKVCFVRRAQEGDGAEGDFLRGLESCRDWFQATDVQPEDMVGVYTTSGSTGVPKQVVRTHRSFFITATPFEDAKDNGTVVFNDAPMSWNAGSLCQDVQHGWTRVLCDKRAGVDFTVIAQFIWGCLQEERCENALLFPIFLQPLCEFAKQQSADQKTRGFIDQRGHGVNRNGNESDGVKPENSAAGVKKLRRIVLGAMPISRPMVQAALRLTHEARIIYAGTEFDYVAFHRVTEADVDEFVDREVGPPMAHVQVKIVDSQDTVLPANQLGRILIKTGALVSGYLNAPEATEALFTKDGYIDTGDVGKLDDRGHLIVSGRANDAIMRGPVIFYPEPIEAQLSACPGVKEVAVVGVPHPTLHEDLCACVVLDSDDVQMEQVRQFAEKDIFGPLKDTFDAPRPRHYLRFDSFPRTFTNKLKRGAIKKKAAEMLGFLNGN